MMTPLSSKARLIPQNAKPGESAEVRPSIVAEPIAIDRLPFTLGRSADRDLCVADGQVSRAHALIDRDADGYFLRDTGSRHGTFVNGMRITTSRLRSRDVVALGTPAQSFVFETDGGGDGNSTRSLLAQLSQTGLLQAGSKNASMSGLSGSSELETLSLFLKAAQSLNQHGALQDVLRTMLEYSIRLTGAERGFVFLGGSADALRFECGQQRDGSSMGAPDSISQSIVRDAANSKLPFLFSAAGDEAAHGRGSIVLHAIRNVVAIPLRSQSSAALLGLLYLDSHAGTHEFTRTRRDILDAIASQATTLFENLRMLEAEREFVLLRKELEIAASIQRQIIPQSLPQFSYAALHARTIPCTSVGGDFYDVIPLDGGFAAIVGDVCGKGIPAALLASMVQGMFHAQMTSGASLVDAVQSLNGFLCKRAPGDKYVTLAALRYLSGGAGNRVVELVNGGHVSPLIVRADGAVETVMDGDMPVGLLEIARFHPIAISMGIGDRIVLLSDGITEAEDIHGTQFSATEMDGYLTGLDPVEALFSALEQFCVGTRPQDDQTVLTIECMG
jgi:sigma-B regulation protein RsbU (phosphoserine phosphatase)